MKVALVKTIVINYFLKKLCMIQMGKIIDYKVSYGHDD